MRPLADQGDVTAQTVVGLMYYFNYGDRVSAYMWFNLAAAQGKRFCGNVSKRHRRQDDTGPDRRGTETCTRVEAEYAIAFSLETP
jgi:TPR repeat protein